MIPNATETDVLVNDAMADMLEKFMTQEVDKIDLPIYSGHSQKTCRITSEGVVIQEYDFKRI